MVEECFFGYQVPQGRQHLQLLFSQHEVYQPSEQIKQCGEIFKFLKMILNGLQVNTSA